MAPNLFYYATKELSQDAFICWLLAWANKECAREDAALNALGLSLAHHGKGPSPAEAGADEQRADTKASPRVGTRHARVRAPRYFPGFPALSATLRAR